MAIVHANPVAQTNYSYQTSFRKFAFVTGQSYLVPFVPPNFERWPDGALYVSNGFQTIQKWNGIQDSFVNAGLTAPVAKPALAGSGSGLITGTYRCYLRYIDEDGNASALSPVSTDVTVTSVASIDYTLLESPLDPRVQRRQVLRNTDGQAAIYYVDIDTTDLRSASLSSTLVDSDLQNQTPVSLFDDQGLSLALAWSSPRNDKPILAFHRQRFFAAGERAYVQGNAQVAAGAVTVTGIGTNWPTELASREFIVRGHPIRYTISSVDAVNQTLTLAAPYQGNTDLFAVYAIRPAYAQRNTIYYSEAGQPDQWHPSHGMTIEEAGQAITALIRGQSFLFCATPSLVYRLTFDTDPALDGSASLFAQRGCANQHTWCRAGGLVFMLDRRGIYALSEVGMIQEIDRPIRNLFNQESATDWKIDWTMTDYFHAVHDPEDSTVRFFISLSGPTLPQHALCYDYLTNNWWLEEFPFPVSSSTLQFASGDRPRPVVGGPGLRLLEQGVAHLDGLNDSGYTTRYAVVSATATSVTTSGLLLPSSGVAGTPIAIVAGTGKGQLRLIDSVSGDRINVTQPWMILPGTTSVLQIGAISWRIKTGWWRRPVGTVPTPLEIVFEPNKTSGTMDMRVYHDHSSVPQNWSTHRPLASKGSDGVGYDKNLPDALVDLTRSLGYVKFSIDQPTGQRSKRGDYLAFEMRGLAGADGMVIYSFGIGPE